MLPKAGSSSFKEQKALISRFIKDFGKENILGILGDREFSCGSLLEWLNKEKIGFYIRIKENTMVHIRQNKLSCAKRIFKQIKPKQHHFFGMTVWVFGEKVYLAASRSEQRELMIIATNKDPRLAIAIYLRRWEIETLFGSLKSKGFRFEETHMTQLDRINKLMTVLAIGFCWAHKVGEWRALKKPITLKKHANTLRPQNNYFRYGLDFIRELILNPFKKYHEFKRCLSALVPTPTQLPIFL